MGQWPLWRFEAMPEDRWEQINEAIKEGTLTFALLDSTGLDVLIANIYLEDNQEINYSDHLSNLVDLERPTSYYYCLYDTGRPIHETEKPQFFISERDIKEAFVNDYCYEIE